jgi:hypothetical protein
MLIGEARCFEKRSLSYRQARDKSRQNFPTGGSSKLQRFLSINNLGAFPAPRAGNRAFRGCAIAPAPALRAVAKPLQSLARSVVKNFTAIYFTAK